MCDAHKYQPKVPATPNMDVFKLQTREIENKISEIE